MYKHIIYLISRMCLIYSMYIVEQVHDVYIFLYIDFTINKMTIVYIMTLKCTKCLTRYGILHLLGV